MRLFIAIMLSDDMKKSVIGTMHELKKADVRGSYVPAQNLHVTLAFIGETKDAAAIKTAMQTISCKPFRMAFADMGVFDNLLWWLSRIWESLIISCGSASRAIRA